MADEINSNITNIDQVADMASVGSNQFTVGNRQLGHLATELQNLVNQLKV